MYRATDGIVLPKVNGAGDVMQLASHLEEFEPLDQQLLGELSGLELGSLNVTPADDAGVEALALIPAGPEDDPFLQCQGNEMRRLLADAIAELPERERMVLTLYYYEELTMREVGATMGVVE